MLRLLGMGMVSRVTPYRPTFSIKKILSGPGCSIFMWLSTLLTHQSNEIQATMQKIVLFVELNDEAFIRPFKLGNLFTNRFAIDEAEGFEILKICELEKTSWKISWPKCPEYHDCENERKQKGMDFNFRMYAVYK